jgi:hypothetical protein
VIKRVNEDASPDLIQYNIDSYLSTKIIYH